MTLVIDQPRPTHSRRSADSASLAGRSWVTITALVVVILATTEGLLLRLWLVFHLSSSADEGMVGMVAQAGLHGHFQAFLGGQSYGGTAEPYVISVAFLVFGQTEVVAELVEVALAAVAALLVWRIVLRLHPDRRLAWLAAALAWCAPTITVVDSILTTGFRGVALVCGLLLVLLSLRIFERGPGIGNLVALGLVAGIGWWSTPEIAYFALPASIILVMAVRRSPAPRRRRWSLPVLLGIVAMVIGAFPWIWANVETGFASSRTSGPIPLPYGGRLTDFFHYGLALDFGLIRVYDGARFFGSAQPFVYGLCLFLLGCLLVLCAARSGRTFALTAAVVAYPFLYAISPFAWDWQDGRYGNYLIPLLAIVISIGVAQAGAYVRLPAGAPVLVLSGIVLLAGCLCVVGLRQWNELKHARLSSSWTDPDDATIGLVRQLERSDIRTGYADYWVAYKLDFYGRGSLAFTTAGYEIERSPTIASEVRRSAHPAWLFVPVNEARREGTQFTAPKLIVGPDTVTEAQFKRTLLRLRIPYREVSTNLLTALVPARALTPFQAGLPGAAPP